MTQQIRLIERGASAAQTREVLVTDTEFVIGRAPDSNLRLRSDEVSRHHCTIRVQGDEVTLMDLGSSNGTYLNEDRVRSHARLKSGDEIRIGSARFVVDLGDNAVSLDTVSNDLTGATLKLPRVPPASSDRPG